jgi:hypothetical protein
MCKLHAVVVLCFGCWQGLANRSMRIYTLDRFQFHGLLVAQAQYSSLLEGLRAVGQVKGWQTQQIVFVGGTCGSVHVESFNKNMKALGVLESKWNLIRQKLVSRLLEEQDKVLRSYFAQKGGTRGQRGEGTHGQGREHVKWDMYV